MQIQAHFSKIKTACRTLATRVLYDKFLVTKPGSIKLAALKDINLIFVVSHLTELRKFTGSNDILIGLSRFESGTKVTALIKRHKFDGSEIELLHYLHMGLVKSIAGELTTESNGKGTRYYFKDNKFREERFSSAIAGTRITAIVPRY